MIISASYRTDIPAFYSEWFMKRLKIGYCKVINPYSNNPYRVELTKDNVQAFVFWTKNIYPFFSNLAFLKECNYPFMIQYSVNNYPKLLENRVIDLQESVQHISKLFNLYGKSCTVWRYDPIVVTSHTPIDWHIDNFSKIAKQLHGMVDEVIVSFMQFYKKALRNIFNDCNLQELDFIDPDMHEKKDLIEKLVDIAKNFDITLSLCAQPHLVSEKIKSAHCIDLNRLSDIAGYEIKAKTKGNRTGCCCAESRDIGAYDSCPHGCVYCYAVSNPMLAVSRASLHDPNDEFLIPTQL
jgi:hypothetical protein